MACCRTGPNGGCCGESTCPVPPMDNYCNCLGDHQHGCPHYVGPPGPDADGNVPEPPPCTCVPGSPDDGCPIHGFEAWQSKLLKDREEIAGEVD